ncbi:hypothetical protein EGW08_002823, partial [Elysia chlorotica]
ATVDCVDDIHPVCTAIGFNQTSKFRSLFSSNMTERMTEFEIHGLSNIKKGCSDLLTFLYCGTIYPNCDFQKPCRSYCLDVMAACGNQLSSRLNCELDFFEVDCLSPDDYIIGPYTTTT